MIEILARLLDPAYLYALDPGPLGRWRGVYLLWAALLAVLLAISLWRRGRLVPGTDRIFSITLAVSSGVGLILLVLRLLAPWAERLPPYTRYLLVEVWTARVWPLSATLGVGLILIVGLVVRLPLPALVRRQADAVRGTLDPAAPPLSWPQSAVLGVLHLLGLGFLWALAGRPPWWSLPALLFLAGLSFFAPPRRLRLETLAPLFFVYAGCALIAGLEKGLSIEIAEYQAFAFPDPLSPWFNPAALIVAGVGLVLWIDARLWTRSALVSIAACLLLAGWMLATAVVHRTHGVTASDPYSYVQMTIDLARRGTPLHDFPLAGLARELELPTWPAVHVGYYPPFFENRSPTMWPIGWSLLMVPLYWIGGLEALYWAAPLFAALALAATWALSNEMLRSEDRAIRWGTAALTCVLVATSPEGSERMLVPMADAAAQLCTVLTLWLLLRARWQRPALHAALAGAALGAAYFIRHPQLPLILSAVVVALLVLVERKKAGQGLKSAWQGALVVLGFFGGAALIVALPDLFYHQRVFGGWLQAESSEWFLISFRHVGRSLFAVVEQGLLRREELGFVAPFAAYGAWRLWRRHRRPALIVGIGVMAVFVFHLLYAALRPRDLIAIWPALYLCAAYGLVRAWQLLTSRRRVVASLLFFYCALLLSARSVRTLAMPWRDDVITFGHVSAAQRQAFDALRQQTPPEAVVASMLNGGAIELHAGRHAVHPAPWTTWELQRWSEALGARGCPFFVLDDGEEMEMVLSRLSDAYTLRPVAELGLPYFALGGGNLPQTAILYEVQIAP